MPTTYLTTQSTGRAVTTTPTRDWHCTKCFRLLGRRSAGRLHLRMSHGHEYFVSLPATATCRCGRMNELRAPVL